MPPKLVSQVTINNDTNDQIIPDDAFIESVIFVAAKVSRYSKPFAINLQIVDEQTMRNLNTTYRGLDKSTNVLSFVSERPQWVNDGFLGDVVLCANVINQEAKKFAKDMKSRWAHIITHGFLHLIGMDHDNLKSRGKMELLEENVMKQLNLSQPYIFN